MTCTKRALGRENYQVVEVHEGLIRIVFRKTEKNKVQNQCKNYCWMVCELKQKTVSKQSIDGNFDVESRIFFSTCRSQKRLVHKPPIQHHLPQSATANSNGKWKGSSNWPSNTLVRSIPSKIRHLCSLRTLTSPSWLRSASSGQSCGVWRKRLHPIHHRICHDPHIIGTLMGSVVGSN